MRLIQTCLFVADLGTVVFQDKKFLKFQHIFQDIKLRKHVEKVPFLSNTTVVTRAGK